MKAQTGLSESGRGCPWSPSKLRGPHQPPKSMQGPSWATPLPTALPAGECVCPTDGETQAWAKGLLVVEQPGGRVPSTPCSEEPWGQGRGLPASPTHPPVPHPPVPRVSGAGPGFARPTPHPPPRSEGSIPCCAWHGSTCTLSRLKSQGVQIL